MPNNLRRGVLAFYPFNQGSLNDASPSSNQLNNPTLATVATGRNNSPLCAYEFIVNGTAHQYLTMPNPEFLNGLKNFTVSLWYYAYSDTLVPRYQVLLGRGDGIRCPDRNGEWSVGLHDCGRPVFGHDNSVWAERKSTLSCEEICKKNALKWNHVVAVKNGAWYRIYMNGKLHQITYGNADCGSMHTARDEGDLFIGKYFHGRLDDIIIWNRALDGSDVKKLFELKACCD